MKRSETIVRAMELLGSQGEHWIQGDYSDGTDNYCMMGALKRAVGADPHGPDEPVIESAQLIAECINGEHVAYPDEFIPGFNDTDGRSFAEVKEAMCTAVKIALEQEASSENQPSAQ